MDLKTALSILLREKRNNLGLSQEGLAYLCDLDRTYISLLERKKRKPTLEVIFRICEALGVNASELVKEIEELIEMNQP